MPRHANAGSFKPGVKPPGAGRPKGVPNKATLAVKELCRNFLDKNYWPTLDNRWKAGNVQWPEVQTILAYAHGKPKESYSVEHSGDLQISGAAERFAGEIVRLAERARAEAVTGSSDGA